MSEGSEGSERRGGKVVHSPSQYNITLHRLITAGAAAIATSITAAATATASPTTASPTVTAAATVTATTY